MFHVALYARYLHVCRSVYLCFQFLAATSTHEEGGHHFSGGTECGGFNEVVDGLNIYANRYNCSTHRICNGFKCDIDTFGFGHAGDFFSLYVWVLPCTNPPSLKVLLESLNFEEKFEAVLTQSTIIQYAELVLNVTVEHLYDQGEIALTVSAD